MLRLLGYNVQLLNYEAFSSSSLNKFIIAKDTHFVLLPLLILIYYPRGKNKAYIFMKFFEMNSAILKINQLMFFNISLTPVARRTLSDSKTIDVM